MLGKHFKESSNKVKIRINSVRINRARPVQTKGLQNKPTVKPALKIEGCIYWSIHSIINVFKETIRDKQ